MRQGGDAYRGHRRRWQPGRIGGRTRHLRFPGRTGVGECDPVSVTGAHRGHAPAAQLRFELLQVDAQPEHLDEAARAADHLVESVGALPGDVAGTQFCQGAAARQIGPVPRVPHHDVRALVDEFAGSVVPAFDRVDPE